MADGNVSTNGKKPSALAALLESLEGKKANDSDKKAVAKKFKEAQGKREAILAQLEAHDKASSELASEMVRCFGAKHIEIDGIRYVPTSRNERIYYKKMSDNPDVEKL